MTLVNVCLRQTDGFLNVVISDAFETNAIQFVMPEIDDKRLCLNVFFPVQFDRKTDRKAFGAKFDINRKPKTTKQMTVYRSSIVLISIQKR